MNICRKLLFLLMAITANLILQPNSLGQTNPKGRAVDQMAASHMSDSRIPGMAVGIIVNGKIVHIRGYGIANVKQRSKVNTRTVFDITSVTKTFTALAIMKLAEDGNLNLDDPLSVHLANMPLQWRPITIRQLISHTSGIPNFTSLTVPRCNADVDVKTYRRGDAINEVTCMPLEYVPGERWKYGDTGFYLAGMIIERASGSKYEDFLLKRVLKPLGMSATQLVDYTQSVPNRARGYSFIDGNVVDAKPFEIDEFANAGITSTLEDMLRLELAFTTERVLKKNSIKKMVENARLNNGDSAAYGLGIGLTPYAGQKRIGHTGGGGLGFASAFTHFPFQKVTVVVLSNADHDGVGEFANTVAAIYFANNLRK